MRVRSRIALRDYIRLMGLSEREVARRAGVSHSTLNHLITGRRPNCSARTAAAIEAELGCAPGLMFASDRP